MPLVTPTDPGGPAALGDGRHRLQQWLTAADRSALFQRQLHEPVFRAAPPEFPVVAVDPERRFQRIDGFGFSLTGGSALLISRLPAAERQLLLRELFLPDGAGIGVSFLRLGIGASDLSEQSFSCDDRPAGEEDFALAHFDIAAGDREVIPLLREILAIAPALRIIATPWSAPPWMKTNGGFVGGTLRRDCFSVYAAYFVRYIRAMREHGITVHAITPQNEPLNRKNEPSMVMEAPRAGGIRQGAPGSGIGARRSAATWKSSAGITTAMDGVRVGGVGRSRGAPLPERFGVASLRGRDFGALRGARGASGHEAVFHGAVGRIGRAVRAGPAVACAERADRIVVQLECRGVRMEPGLRPLVRSAHGRRRGALRGCAHHRRRDQPQRGVLRDRTRREVRAPGFGTDLLPGRCAAPQRGFPRRRKGRSSCWY